MLDEDGSRQLILVNVVIDDSSRGTEMSGVTEKDNIEVATSGPQVLEKVLDSIHGVKKLEAF